jgi:hypothetical protein
MKQFWLIFLGAFLGTISAFALESWSRRVDRTGSRFEALLAAQATLLAQGNSLAAFLAQFPTGMNPFDDLKHIFVGFSKQCLEFSGLAFVGASHNPQLVIDLDVADAAFRMAVDSAALRNQLLDRFFDHSETEILSFDDETGAVRAKGNAIIMRNLRQGNQITFNAMRRAQELNRETAHKLAMFAKVAFPRERKFPIATQKESQRTSPVL